MANVPTTSWDEESPAGSQSILLGDNRIREMKTQIREVIDVDHDFPASGQAETTGQHKQVTLQEQEDIGSGASGVPILGAQTIDDKPELVYTDEDDNDIQITKGGKIYSGNMTTDLLELIYPVGIVVTLGVSTNPATLFGIGTWTAIAGKVIVGINAGDAEFDTLDETGGEKTHVLLEAELAAHDHYVANSDTSGSDLTSSNYMAKHSTVGGDEATVLIGSATTPSIGHSETVGSGTAHNNLQPYIVKYVWQRTE